jgi:hypothetical protein
MLAFKGVLDGLYMKTTHAKEVSMPVPPLNPKRPIIDVNSMSHHDLTIP